MWHFLVELSAVGATLRLARATLNVHDTQRSRWLNFRDALTNLRVPDFGEDSGTVEISITTTEVDAQELRESGIMLSGARAEVSLWRDGYDYDQRIVVLSGSVDRASVRRTVQDTSMTLVDDSGTAQRPFPPWTFNRAPEAFTTDSNGFLKQYYYGFPDIPESELGKAMNVIIGTVKRVPLTLVDKLGDWERSGALESDWDVVIPSNKASFRWVLAGHRVRSDSVVLWCDGDISRKVVADVSQARDPITGAEYSYVTIDANNSNADGASSMMAESVDGHMNSMGGVVTGLGDAVMLMLQTYSGLADIQLDHDRLARFVPKANRIRFSGVFGGDGASTLLDTLVSRIGGQFPIQFSFRGGKFGADWLLYDDDDQVVKRLRYGADLIDRIDPVAMDDEVQPADVFTIEYDPDPWASKRPGAPGFSKKSRTEKERDNERAWAAQDLPLGITGIGDTTMWAEPPISHPPLELVDINDDPSAQLILEGLKQLHSVLRTRVQYLARVDDVIHLPLWEKYWITDSEMGWSDEPFRLVRMRINEDDTAVVTLVSYNEAP